MTSGNNNVTVLQTCRRTFPALPFPGSTQYKEVGDREYARQLALSRVDRPQRDAERAFGPKPKQQQPPPPL